MKQILTAFALIMSMTLMAQKPVNPGARGLKQAERLKAELQLNDQQYASVRTINQKYAKEFVSVRNNEAMEKKEKHVQLKAMKQERAEDISAVLTPEQKVKWEKLRAENKEKKKAKVKQRKENIESLNLTAHQKTKMKEAHQAFKSKARALKAEEKSSKDDRKAAMKSLKLERDSEVRKILTDEQFAKWKEMKKNGKKGRGRGKR
jgi:Spy/CpxP family protein refolding chaperone